MQTTRVRLEVVRLPMITGRVETGRRRSKVVEGHAGENRLQQYCFYRGRKVESYVRSKGVRAYGTRNSMRRSIQGRRQYRVLLYRSGVARDGGRARRVENTIGMSEKTKTIGENRSVFRVVVSRRVFGERPVGRRPRPRGQWRRPGASLPNREKTTGFSRKNANAGRRADRAGQRCG